MPLGALVLTKKIFGNNTKSTRKTKSKRVITNDNTPKEKKILKSTTYNPWTYENNRWSYNGTEVRGLSQGTSSNNAKSLKELKTSQQ